MTNKEKAYQLYNELSHKCGSLHYGHTVNALVAMAEWKDELFKKYLAQRLKEYKNSINTSIDDYDLGYMDAIDEIIKEFFEEIEQDNSDKEE